VAGVVTRVNAEEPDAPADHVCIVCGERASFGFGPRADLHLVRDHPERIKWYCFEHRPVGNTDNVK
jgi:hypothetical protein